MNAQKLDVLLCPTSSSPARPHETSRYWSYTSFYNLLDWPGIVFPTGRHVDAKIDAEDADYQTRNDSEKDVYANCESCSARRQLMTDDAAYSVDAPISLQLVAPRWQDERLFAAAKIIQQALPL